MGAASLTDGGLCCSWLRCSGRSASATRSRSATGWPCGSYSKDRWWESRRRRDGPASDVSRQRARV